MSAEPSPPKRIRDKESSMPIEVVILTRDHEIQGTIYVSRDARADRRITDLLNDAERRFLAVTDARLISRVGPSSPRLYSFLQLHIDNVVMIHPSVQALANTADYSKDEALRFDELRGKFNRPPAASNGRG